ncbi:testis-specific gene 10 protein-like isoform X2 [Dysidea avara]
MLDVMTKYGNVGDSALSDQIKKEIRDEVERERSEQQSKGEDLRRQEQLNSLALQLKNESDQKAIVEQLQQQIAEEDTRRKQLNYSLEKEKENNMRLYEQYLKTLKDLQSLQTQHINCVKVLKDLQSLQAQQTRNELQTRQQILNMQEDHKMREMIWKEQLGLRNTEKYTTLSEENASLKQEVETLKTQLEAAELAIKKDDEEWRQDYGTLSKEKDSLKEQNDTLTEEISALKQADTSSKQEIETLKEQLEAAELAIKKDDEEWRQDYNTVTKERDALKEERDALKEDRDALKEESGTLTEENSSLKEENETLKQEKQAILDSQKDQLDAAVVAQKSEDSEWRLECDSLKEQIVSVKQENEKLLEQQLDVALIGRRTSIEELEGLKTSYESLTQQYEVLKVANEEAEKEIVLLQNDKSTLVEEISSLEKQLKCKESEIEELSKAAENKKPSGLATEVDQFRRSTGFVEPQHLLAGPNQKELDNVKLQLAKTKTENEQMCNETNALRRELQATADQLSLQKRLHQQDIELLQIKFQKKEDEWNIIVNNCKEEINLLQQQKQDLKQDKEIFSYAHHNIDVTESLGPQRINHSPVTQQARHSNSSSPMPLFPTPIDQSNITIQSELVKTSTSSEIPKTSTSLNFPRPFHSQSSPTSSSMPSLRSNSGAVYSRRTVVTANGEENIMCKQFSDVADLQCEMKVIVHRSDKYEYATVRAFPVGKTDVSHLVGIELDLPNGSCDGELDGVRHFNCTPNYGLFIPLQALYKIIHL